MHSWQPSFSQDVLGNPISIDDSAETLSRVLDAKAVVVKGEKPQLQVRRVCHSEVCLPAPVAGWRLTVSLVTSVLCVD